MARKHTQMPEFGPELRRLRTAAGLSTGGLAALIHYSKGYISKVETGQQMSPSSHFARKTDAALAAGGRLIALAEEQAEAKIDTADRDTGSLAPLPQIEVQRGDAAARRTDAAVDEAGAEHSLEAFRSILVNLRDLGQTIDPSAVVDMLKPHVLALQDLAARLEGSLADEALLLAAHFADFTSWMTQETGDDITALRWINTSATFAGEANDIDMVANSYVRRANIALYQQDGYGTITFAKQAQAMECGLRVKGLAALREAQGHALAGDYEQFRVCIDRAVALSAKSGEERQDPPVIDRPVIGPTKIRDPLALAKGWSLYDLGRSTEAIEVLEPLLAQTPKVDNRAWARIACRLALALASVRKVDRACGLAKDIVSLTTVARSATIRSDLRQLSRMLNRWSSDPTVREIMPLLSAALLPTADGHSLPPPVPRR